MRVKQKAVRSGYLLFALLVFLSACGTSPRPADLGQAPVHHLVVLHTNDTHGHPVKFTFQLVPDVGGLPARATLVNRIRKNNQNVLLLDAGDINTGAAISNLFKAEPDIEGFNYIGYDAMVLGNHEFDNPPAVLKGQMELARFPFLSANIRTRDGEYFARPYMIKAFPEFKVAVFGLTTKTSEIIGHPENVRDLVFQDEIEVAKSLVPKLRQQADVVIALVHMGIFPSSLEGSRRLASEVDGIDLIVDGHSHTKLEFPIVVKHAASGHETVIVQAWKWGLLLGKVDLRIQNSKVADIEFETIPINLKKVDEKPDGTKVYDFMGGEIAEDPKLLALLQPYADEVDKRLSQVIGHAEGTFFSHDVRHGQTPVGTLVANSMLWFTRSLDVDFAIQNGGGIRADLPAGPITMKQLYDILPFDNSVVVLTMKGSQVQSLFEGLSTITPGLGAFPQISEGVKFTKSGMPRKFANVLINGHTLDPDRVYKIATNSYLAAGGDGYKMFSKVIQRYDTAVSQRDVLADYIRYLGGTIKPGPAEMIRRTSESAPGPAYPWVGRADCY